ncbi:uncharacterized protein VTP21DRAFT_5094 [Calcarisporiella thermophila]|uniref:uncharacterized protein n=1 Tax=Calcarisporiella thermophila TaxID=911321 RepID=UPI0037427F38
MHSLLAILFRIEKPPDMAAYLAVRMGTQSTERPAGAVELKFAARREGGRAGRGRIRKFEFRSRSILDKIQDDIKVLTLT